MSAPLLDEFCSLLSNCSQAWSDPRPRSRVRDLALGLLCGQGQGTITRALRWLDRTQADWSTSYRLFSQAHWDIDQSFAPVAEAALDYRADDSGPIYAAQDDTLIRKSGRLLPGTSWARDPLSPPFQVNLVWGQRFLLTGLLVRPQGSARPWRSIPVGFRHVPPLKAPRGASTEERAQVRKARKKNNTNTAAADDLRHLRERINQCPAHASRLLLNAVDGGFANKAFLSRIPPNTEVVARFRKDAKLRQYLPPEQRRGARKYGAFLRTPEEYLRDESIPWQQLTVFVASEMRVIHYKEVNMVCWPKATGPRPLRLIILRPAGYRLRKGSKLLYRQPAYLISTATELDIAHLIQSYLARWELEVNFRDAKTIVGVGQAQVRNAQSVPRTPAFMMMCYAALLLASLFAFDDHRTEAFPRLPAWRTQPLLRPSITDLITKLRKEALAHRHDAHPSFAA